VGHVLDASEVNAVFIYRVEVDRMIAYVTLKVEVASASEMYATWPAREETQEQR
jgi:hypothetical protein